MFFNLEYGMHSVPGYGRTHNEDNIGHYIPRDPETIYQKGQLFIIADGMGQGGQGKIASQMTIEAIIEEYYEEPWVGNVENMLLKAVREANKALYGANLSKGDQRFSCAVSCAVVHQQTLYIVHVGNCRIFLLNNNRLEKLTRNHSFNIDKKNDDLDIQDEEGGEVLVRMLGSDEEVEIDQINKNLHVNDIIFLCSDGVYDIVSEIEIKEIISSVNSQQAAETVVSYAQSNENQDDASALMIKVSGIRRELPDDDQAEESSDRQIVIKGVRYRSSRKNQETEDHEQPGIYEFTEDRETRQKNIKRTAQAPKKKKSINDYLGMITIIVLLGIMAILYLLFGSDLWKTNLMTRDTTSPQDSTQQFEDTTSLSLQTNLPKEIPVTEDFKDTVVAFVLEDIEIEEDPVTEVRSENKTIDIINDEPVEEESIRIVVTDGSFKGIFSLSQLINDMKNVSEEEDRFKRLTSSFKMQKTKIIWRRSTDELKNYNIQQHVEKYQEIFKNKYKIDAETNPLDFTLVLGGDFKLPVFPLNKVENKSANIKDYYLEVLNGSTAKGLAKRMKDLLHHQCFGVNRMIVIDYRNADTKNYKRSFLKCSVSDNRFVKDMSAALRLPKYIVNAPLYDIKVIVGADVK